MDLEQIDMSAGAKLRSAKPLKLRANDITIAKVMVSLMGYEGFSQSLHFGAFSASIS